MEFVRRKNPLIQEAVEVLDQHFYLHFDQRLKMHECVRKAFQSLGSAEEKFIEGEIRKCRDPITGSRYYLENYHVIKAEDGSLRSFVEIWEAQEIFFSRVLEIQMEGRPVKIVVLKARQLGLSTISEALIFHKTIFTRGCNTLIVAQDIYQADYLFSMSRIAHEYLPWWMKPDKWYEAKGKYMEFDRPDDAERTFNPGLKSKLFVEAANKMAGVAVGKTMRNAHLSELSRWPNGEVLGEQILPSLNHPEALVILESTALGKDNFFYTFWKRVVEGMIPQWEPVFIEFFRVKKYSLPIPRGTVFERTKEENALCSKVQREKGVTIVNEQLHWRRSKIQEAIAIKGSEQSFYQEYPAATWMEAFQGSGLCAFDRKKLQIIMETTCCAPRWFGEIDIRVDEHTKVKTPKLFAHRNMSPEIIKAKGGLEIPPAKTEGRLRIWEMPEDGHGYYIGVDTAEGLEGGDYSCAQVIKIGRGLQPDFQVAEWHGWIDATPFARVLWSLGWLYNEAEISVEVQEGTGVTTNNYLWQNLEYEKIFRWKKYDKIRNQVTDYYGWTTNIKTRPLIINKTKEAITEDVVILRSEELIDEMMDFGRDGRTRKIQGQTLNDDRVMAFLIAYWCAHDSDWGKEIASTPLDEQRKDKDFQNTAYSPIYDKDGLQRKAFHELNVPAEFVHEVALYNHIGADGEPEADSWRCL